MAQLGGLVILVGIDKISGRIVRCSHQKFALLATKSSAFRSIVQWDASLSRDAQFLVVELIRKR